MHIFHKWKKVYYEEIENHQGWVRHDSCTKCKKDRFIIHLNFFSTIDDAIDVGILAGIYKGFHPQFKFDD